MAEFIGTYYSENIVFKEISLFDEKTLESGIALYEVIRILKGTALFLEDHLKRLQQSVILSGYSYSVSSSVIHYVLRNLIKRNNIHEGNVKITILFNEFNNPVIYTYFIPHAYPNADMYMHGVDADFYHASRTDPNIKRANPEFRREISEFIKSNSLYDVILISSNDFISEGSKTNVFFIGEGIVYTSPANKVLKGVTRDKIFHLCHDLSISVKEEEISVNDLRSFDAAFFSGTSPKILPIKRIADIHLNIGNPLMRSLMTAYDDLVTSYIFHW